MDSRCQSRHGHRAEACPLPGTRWADSSAKGPLSIPTQANGSGIRAPKPCHPQSGGKNHRGLGPFGQQSAITLCAGINLHVVYFGRMVEQKRPDYLVR
jgi:hypothetical protein